MIRIKGIKASEVKEYYDYDDGLTVIIYPDTIENDL